MRVHHLAFRTADVGRLERFYVGLLGFRVERRQGDRSVWLAMGDALLMLERKDVREPDVPSGSLELVAFAVTPEEHVSYMERFASHGVGVDARTAFTTYVRDPDGRRIALSSYPNPAAPPPSAPPPST